MSAVTAAVEALGAESAVFGGERVGGRVVCVGVVGGWPRGVCPGGRDAFLPDSLKVGRSVFGSGICCCYGNPYCCRHCPLPVFGCCRISLRLYFLFCLHETTGAYKIEDRVDTRTEGPQGLLVC